MAKKAKKYVYFFGGGKAEGNAQMRDLLGGKGANLAEMCSLGLPVPPGFTITTEACNEFYRRGKKWPAGLAEQVDKHLARLEKISGKTFGGVDNPLLVSVRSGAAVSMPGMMDTVLNLGLNDQTLQGLIRLTNNERFGWDAYRRFMQMFGDVVLGIEHDAFEHALQAVKDRRGAKYDTDLDVEGLKEVVEEYKKVYAAAGKSFPQDVREQLSAAIDAVFNSWNNERAIKYREIHNIKGLLGTAVNVQMMVFGNMGSTSGTGVAFTRNPATGENKFYGEYLMNAQGEDVVAGIRTPQPISTLSRVDPKSYKQLLDIRKRLEKHYRDMQDIEFTIERGKLYILQTRTGKRTAAAAVRIAVDMMKERLITEKEAILRVDPTSLDQLLHPMFDPKAEKAAKQISSGLPASPGAATGQIVFSADDAEAWAKDGKAVILCRIETSPEDIGGMSVAQGILTSRGGMTSHAAVVARGMGKCCVAGASDLIINYATKTLTVGEMTFHEGDWISLNGSTGAIYAGKIETVEPKLTGPFGTIMKLADKYRQLGVRANADTPRDAEMAVRFGAEGIGLTRTEHMFFEGDRIIAMREMILAEDEKGRRKALDKLLPIQREDFEGIFTAMENLPVTVRLLDPPLHEFVPKDDKEQKEMAAEMGISFKEVKARVESLSEINPMLGHRGCRLGNTYPEITEMQTRAIIEAALNLKAKGIIAKPEIMIPLIGTVEEFKMQEEIVRKVAEQVFSERNDKINYLVGTMIEIPRAALTADKVAKHAEFFSYGTNDLTQMTYGYSRDDAGKFLKIYIDKGILKHDPFQVLDQEGVGQLVEMGVIKGRAARPGLKIGICGEHGGDPASIDFCHRIGLDYVSCSTYRVPIARLAAAHAAVRNK